MDNLRKPWIMRDWYNLLIMKGMMDKGRARWIIKETMDK
jgi:hypothetical protein